MHRIASIPARINIIGEHTDYAGGLSFAFAAPQRLTLKATAIKEGFEGEVTENNIEIAIIGEDREFKVLTASEVRDYINEME